MWSSGRHDPAEVTTHPCGAAHLPPRLEGLALPPLPARADQGPLIRPPQLPPSRRFLLLYEHNSLCWPQWARWHNSSQYAARPQGQRLCQRDRMPPRSSLYLSRLCMSSALPSVIRHTCGKERRRQLLVTLVTREWDRCWSSPHAGRGTNQGPRPCPTGDGGRWQQLVPQFRNYNWALLAGRAPTVTGSAAATEAIKA